MRGRIQWRSSSPDVLASLGNLTLNERVLDLLADILFAADEIRDMVELEHGRQPFEGFEAALSRIQAEACSIMRSLAEPPAREGVRQP